MQRLLLLLALLASLLSPAAQANPIAAISVTLSTIEIEALSANRPTEFNTPESSATSVSAAQRSVVQASSGMPTAASAWLTMPTSGSSMYFQTMTAMTSLTA